MLDATQNSIRALTARHKKHHYRNQMPVNVHLKYKFMHSHVTPCHVRLVQRSIEIARIRSGNDFVYDEKNNEHKMT